MAVIGPHENARWAAALDASGGTVEQPRSYQRFVQSIHRDPAISDGIETIPAFCSTQELLDRIEAFRIIPSLVSVVPFYHQSLMRLEPILMGSIP